MLVNLLNCGGGVVAIEEEMKVLLWGRYRYSGDTFEMVCSKKEVEIVNNI